ncbi:MAG: long-chain fatty acid-CoA ligase [Thermoleophilia bacterium]|nr:long-chain fatty acid-CoA ligase [Thermoleophilia bacterium]
MDDQFEQTALDLYRAQRTAIPAYDAWCTHELAQREDDQVRSWREIPALPIAAFKQLEVWAPDAPVAATWLSSGTTSEERSSHRIADLAAYDAAIDEGVHQALLPDVVARARDPLACVQLQPDRHAAPNSSLSYMFDRIRTSELCADAGVFVGGNFAVDQDGAWSRLEALTVVGQPVLVLATSFALALLFDAVRDAERAPIELPLGSRVVDTGGYKGRTRELIRPELLARIESWLGVTEEWCENEYGMSELSSQAWLGTVAEAAGFPLELDEPFARWTPSTLRVRVVDPVTLEDVDDGEPGLLVFHDIANVHTCAAVRSEDIGVRRGESFELVGRAPGATLKGCSLRLEDVVRG